MRKLICNLCHEYITGENLHSYTDIDKCFICGEIEIGKYETEQSVILWQSEEYHKKKMRE